METALLIFQLLYAEPVKEVFVAPHNQVELIVNSGSQGQGLTTRTLVTPTAIKEGQNPAPPNISEPQGVRPDPTGCPYGDSIPLDACDKFKP